MLKIICLLLFMGSVVGAFHFYSRRAWRELDKIINRSPDLKIMGDDDDEEEDEEDDDESEAPAEITELDFDINPDFDVEGVPYCDDGDVPYVDILHGYNRWYETYAAQKGRSDIANWLQPALTRLEGQGDSIDFATTDIQRLLDLLAEKGLMTVAGGSAEKVQKVLNTFCKNRTESVELLEHIHWTDDKKLLKKLKSTLYCMMDDNDELINGLDTFRIGIQSILAKVCEDQRPDHITDFTDLHELLKVPSMIDRVLAQVEEAQRTEEAAQKADVPTIEVPATDRRILDYFPELALGTKPDNESNDSARQIVDGKSSSPISDGF